MVVPVKECGVYREGHEERMDRIASEYQQTFSRHQALGAYQPFRPLKKRAGDLRPHSQYLNRIQLISVRTALAAYSG